MNTENKLYINVAIIGCTSAGKSTLLNSLFLEDLATMKISRCTMVPQIYKEAKTQIKTAKEINKEGSVKNEEIARKIEDLHYIIDKNDFLPIEFYVHKIENFGVLNKKINFAFYDIPGLNHPSCQEIYYNYVKENCDIFDIILFVINIESALSGADELNILKSIIKNCSTDKNKIRYIIPIINKSDNMIRRRGTLHCDPKNKSKVLNIINVLNDYKAKYDYFDYVLEPLLFSAQEAYVYRNLLKNPEFELAEEFKDAVGFSHMGRLYHSLTDEEKEEKLREIFTTKKDFVAGMISLSGYEDLIIIFSNILTPQNQFYMCYKKIIDEYKKLLSTVDCFNTDINKLFYDYELLCARYNKLQKIFYDFEIDPSTNIFDHNTNINLFFDKIVNGIALNDFEILNKCLGVLDNIVKHPNYADGYINYLGGRITQTQNEIIEHIYNFYNIHYEKRWNLEELCEIIEQLKKYTFSQDKINEFAKSYVESMILNEVVLCYDFTNNNNVITYDNILIKLEHHIDKSIISSIYKWIIVSKISTLIKNINNDINIEDNTLILYNLMIFYQFNSTRNIELSEIYSMLLLNMISLVNSNKINMSLMRKIDDFFNIDKCYINILLEK